MRHDPRPFKIITAAQMQKQRKNARKDYDVNYICMHDSYRNCSPRERERERERERKRKTRRENKQNKYPFKTERQTSQNHLHETIYLSISWDLE